MQAERGQGKVASGCKIDAWGGRSGWRARTSGWGAAGAHPASILATLPVWGTEESEVPSDRYVLGAQQKLSARRRRRRKPTRPAHTSAPVAGTWQAEGQRAEGSS